MTNDANVASMSNEALMLTYTQNVRSYEATKHVGRQNRLYRHRLNISAEMKARDAALLSGHETIDVGPVMHCDVARLAAALVRSLRVRHSSSHENGTCAPRQPPMLHAV
jgi:hypothetical protein